MEQQSILMTIHERCANDRRFTRCQNASIRNLVVCTYAAEDAEAKAFCSAVETYFQSGHMLRFLAYQKPELAIGSAVLYAQNTLTEFAQGVNWGIETVLVLSDEQQARHQLERSSQHTSALLLEPGETSANTVFHERLIRLPYRMQEREQAMQTAAVYLLSMIQGVEFSPFIDNSNVNRNRLYGYFYDCIEQRMRCETAENLAGLLCQTTEEISIFRAAVERSADLSVLGAANGYVVDTAGYEQLAARIQMNLPASFFKRLLCRLSKRYRQKHITWSCHGIRCGEAVEQLLGKNYWSNASEVRDPNATVRFTQWWDRSRDTVLNTTLKILTSAVEPNGLLNGWQEELKRGLEAQRLALLRERELPFTPQGRSLQAMLQEISGVTSVMQQMHELNLMHAWYGFVKEQAGRVIRDKQLEQKQELYGSWLTQLDDELTGEVKAVYRWDADPVAPPTSATLADRDDDRFDVDAGMMWLRGRRGEKTGNCLLLASGEYAGADWGAPSGRKNGISNIQKDQFTLLDGLKDTQLVLLCMDA